MQQGHLLFIFIKDKNPTFNSEYDNAIYNYPLCHGKERLKHPTQKPLGLIKDLIIKHSNKGDIVLDTFAGTSSYATTASYALNGSSGGGIYLSSESFFANGLSSSYTITSSVLEASEDIFVFINGLVQAPTTNYSLSSSILVFNGVPSTGSLIEVRRFDANISGSGGGGGGGGTTLTTGSSYPITSSWAITASYALAGLVFGNIDGGNPSEIYSYNSNIDGGNP